MNVDVDPQPTPLSRAGLIEAILAFLAHQPPEVRVRMRRALEIEIDAAGADALTALTARLHAERGWAYYERDPLAQRLHHVLADHFVADGSGVANLHHLGSVNGAPVVMAANHLSYADANVVEVLLQRAGHPAYANRLTALAGPKVYSTRVRRFSSLCFGTIRVPQSTGVASGEAVLSEREVARAARQAINVAHDRVRSGDILLMFAEGTRSRTGEMQPLLPAAARYLDVPGTWVVPVGLVGPEAMFPIESSRLSQARVSLHIGAPMPASALLSLAGGDRKLVVDMIGLAIADVLPPAYRGVYGDAARFDAASRLRASVAT
ncbi:MAG: lysophospholipid acyltransferase family protein [Vicinamibacterales bacterium]